MMKFVHSISFSCSALFRIPSLMAKKIQENSSEKTNESDKKRRKKEEKKF